MGKRRGGNNSGPPSTLQLLSQSSISIREEATGKLQTKGGARNPKSFLRLHHLQDLALWATKDAPLPSLGAFFGRQYAAAAEALGAPPDPNLVSCQRCETVLHAGVNCTVRVEKFKRKARRRSKQPTRSPKNSVVYKCLFCSHCNLKRGTARDYMKELCPPKQKSAAKLEPAKPKLQEARTVKGGRASAADITNPTEMALPVTSLDTKLALPPIVEDASPGKSPATPATTGASLLDAKRKKRNRSGAKKPLDNESNSAVADSGKPTNASQKRKRRKSWTTLKEIVESTKKDHVPVPFFI